MTFNCTKETPWAPEIEERPVCHEDVIEIGEQESGYPGGDIITMECQNCKHTWKQELPQ